MTCRSKDKCAKASAHILQSHKNANITTLELDLADLNSVWNCSATVRAKFHRLDILINNAGLVSDPGYRTVQGFEGLFGTMHIGHFALTKWLLPLLLLPLATDEDSILKASRVVNVASEAYSAGSFHPSFFSSENGFGDLHGEVTDNCATFSQYCPLSCCPLLACPYTNGYARAKLANVMHAKELQRILDEQAAAYKRKSLSALEGSGIDGMSCERLRQLSYPLPKFCNIIVSGCSGLCSVQGVGIAIGNGEGEGKGNYHRRVVTASLHPGSVHTDIHPLLSSAFTALFLRTSDVVTSLADDARVSP